MYDTASKEYTYQWCSAHGLHPSGNYLNVKLTMCVMLTRERLRVVPRKRAYGHIFPYYIWARFLRIKAARDCGVSRSTRVTFKLR